jgi:hypothetical protein
VALPNGVATVTATAGPYLLADGSVASGRVWLIPETRVVHAATGAVITPDGVAITLDPTTGLGSAVVAAGDDPSLSPNPFRYRVLWELVGRSNPEPTYVLLPAANATADLDNMVPATSGAGPVSVPAVTSLAGLSGALTAAQVLAVLLPPPLPVPVSGSYVFPVSPQAATTNNALGNGTARFVPFVMPRSVTVTRIGSEVTAAGEAGSSLRLGIYADNGNAQPGTLVVDAGAIASGTAAGVQELTLATPVTLTAGVPYWLGGVVQGAPTTQPTIRTVSQGSVVPPFPVPLPGGMPIASAAVIGAAWNGLTSGPLPATAPLAFAAGAAPRLFLRIA